MTNRLLDPLNIGRPRRLRWWHLFVIGSVVVLSLGISAYRSVRDWLADDPVLAPEVPSTAVMLDVPFTSQAPFANWDMPYQEACEETSILMVVRYLQGRRTPISASEANIDIVALTNYVARQGYGVSLTAREAEQVIEAYFYGFDALVVDNPTVDALKQFIDDGYPVIVPAAGRELNNPHFTGLGPPFHMVVIRGYTDDAFVTNDPGTKYGEKYMYPIDTLMEAISDYNEVGPDVGAKRVIVIQPVM